MIILNDLGRNIDKIGNTKCCKAHINGALKNSKNMVTLMYKVIVLNIPLL